MTLSRITITLTKKRSRSCLKKSCDHFKTNFIFFDFLTSIFSAFSNSNRRLSVRLPTSKHVSLSTFDAQLPMTTSTPTSTVASAPPSLKILSFPRFFDVGRCSLVDNKF